MINNLKDLKKEFSKPGIDYRVAPLLRINDEIDENQLRWQIKSLKDQGFGGIFICCEKFFDSAPDKFTSDWWWGVIDLSAKICAEEGINYWVYDDEDWPSGSVGGKLTETYPEDSWKYLNREDFTFKGPTTAEIDIDLGGGLLAAVVAYQIKDGIVVSKTLTDLTETVKDNKLVWDVPNGDWTVTVYTGRPGLGIFIDGYGDLMDKKAMGDFVDMVYKAHHDRVSNIPGAKIKGYFTDEPAFSYAMIEWGERFFWYPTMPFTPELDKTFTERHGFSWRKNLPLAFKEADTDRVKYLCAYWETCNYLYSVNYFKQIYDFCGKHGYLATGHQVAEERFENHLAQSAGNLPTHYRYFHIPGIDWIHPIDGNVELPSTVPKYATSMAHLLGRERTWCESFAAIGWGCSFQEIRRIVNWEHVNGINMQVPICYKYSLRGLNRCLFYNPGISYQQPYWDQIYGFTEYEARMCVLASGGGHIAQVLMAYPDVDIWRNSWNLTLLAERSSEYNKMGDLIRKAHYDYDILVDTDILESTKVKDGKITTDTESFDILVMPKADAVRLATIERCKEIVKSGGYVIFTGNLARDSFENGGNDPKLAALIKELFGSFNADNLPETVYWNNVGKGKVGFAPTAEDVPFMIKMVVKPDVRVTPDDENIIVYHRQIEDGHVYLVFNNSNDVRTVKIQFSAKGYPEIWNAETGKATSVQNYVSDDKGTTLTLKFSGYELTPVIISSEKSKEEPDKLNILNEILIDGLFDFEIEDTTKRPEIAWNFDQEERKELTPVALEIKAPEKIPAGDWCQFGLSTFSGLGIYSKKINLGPIPADAKVMLELGRVGVSAEVYVNDNYAGVVYFAPFRLDVTGLIKEGENSIKIVVANTLSNKFSKYVELAEKGISNGGDLPERRVSGLIGPVKLQIFN